MILKPKIVLIGLCQCNLAYNNLLFSVDCADVVEQGWIVDPASQMLTVKKQVVVKEQRLDPGKLQNLTEYVFYLEH